MTSAHLVEWLPGHSLLRDGGQMVLVVKGQVCDLVEGKDSLTKFDVQDQ